MKRAYVFIKTTLWMVLVLAQLSFEMPKSNPKDDLVKMIQAYQSATSGHMVFDLSLVGAPLNPKDKRGEIYFENANLYSSVMGRVVICNEKLQLTVDDNNKILYVSGPIGKADLTKRIDAIEQLNEFISKVPIAAVSNTNGEKTFEFSDPQSGDTYRYTLDKQYWLKGYECKYANPALHGVSAVVIDYTTMDMNIRIPKEKFSVSNYLTWKNSTPVGVGKYAKYQLINALKK